MKLALPARAVIVQPSRPTWARGLKHDVGNDALLVVPVAPHVGAWIETLGYREREVGR